MKVTIKLGNQIMSKDMAHLPKIGESIRIVVPGAPVQSAEVRKRTWVFEPGKDAEVELDCG